MSWRRPYPSPFLVSQSFDRGEEEVSRSFPRTATMKYTTWKGAGSGLIVRDGASVTFSKIDYQGTVVLHRQRSLVGGNAG